MAENWSAKEAKKAGQKFRREAKSIFADYQKSLVKHLNEMRLVLRPRPRYVPKPVFDWARNFFMDTSRLNSPVVMESPSDYLMRKHHEAVARQKGHSAVPVVEEEEEGAEWQESDEIGDILDIKDPADLSTPTP